MKRIRDFSIIPGTLMPGTYNALTDVQGVRVGHMTLIQGDTVRTGVTAIVPAADPFVYKIPAAVTTINGYGKAIGFEQIRELGVIETPIVLTNTLSAARAADAVIGHMIAHYPALRSVNPVVGETNDGYLNDIRQRVITAEHVTAAIRGATDGPVAEGCVGAGMGTACYQFKGGIGTASRIVPTQHAPFTVGALVQTNFGLRHELHILGVPVGANLPHVMPGPLEDAPAGSIVVILATDAPLTSRQLERLARRAVFGIARTGTIGHGGSGDFVIAFSTAQTRAHSRYQTTQPLHWVVDESPVLDGLFHGVVESVEEAIYNALTAAQTVTGRKGYTLHALPHATLHELLSQYGRITRDEAS
ncbi:MAG: P1 family peptidase [Chloroflexota bacterium]